MTEDEKWQKNWADHQKLFERVKETGFWTKFGAIATPTTVIIMGVLNLIF